MKIYLSETRSVGQDYSYRKNIIYSYFEFKTTFPYRSYMRATGGISWHFIENSVQRNDIWARCSTFKTIVRKELFSQVVKVCIHFAASGAADLTPSYTTRWYLEPVLSSASPSRRAYLLPCVHCERILRYSMVYILQCPCRRAKKNPSSALPLLLLGIHRVIIFPHKRPVIRNEFHIMTSSWKYPVESVHA